ncbi:MAG: hypothetical protein N3D12_00165 [Candidatus Methanomethyliaceae archaeon]|nr:hypothetical protein [Candidatus Methanomethyliaceae archaeon]
MLQSGEHVVLDLDHLSVLLKIAEGSEAFSQKLRMSGRGLYFCAQLA